MEIALSVILWTIFGLILIVSIKSLYNTWKKRKEEKAKEEQEE